MNQYEVTLKLANRNTLERSLVTRTEYAYSVQDAVMQACFNQSAEMETGSADITLVSVGPPAELIRRASSAATDAIAEELMRAIRQSKGPHAIDAVGVAGGKATVGRPI